MIKNINTDIFRIDESRIGSSSPSIKNEIKSNKENQYFDNFEYLPENSIHKGQYGGKYFYENTFKDQYYHENERRYQWLMATKDNAFEDAKDFENFVYKWMDKGLSFDQAVERAELYAYAGVLDYGKQKVATLYDLPYPDPKNHGFHLIDNPVLKKAFIETLDQLEGEAPFDLVFSLFGDIAWLSGNPDLCEKANDTDGFLEKFQAFALKLEKLKEENPDDFKDIKFSFTGDITINYKQSIDYQNFILETIISFFEDRLDYYDNLHKTASFQMFYEYPLSKEEHNEIREQSLATVRDPLKKLLENFKNSASQYNSNINENNSILNQYTKNNRPNILNTIQ
ncbi:hypothetical protein [Arcobacter vandammei]|uniref:hypothetical protein n=1 Tax=Arcobacter vandammei TaxID=2782243 RepID=UPI0018E0077D|nr:hypothetical protein [Arcobacter vandammei]